MNQPVLVQEAEGGSDGRAQPDAFADGQAPALGQIIGQGSRLIKIRIDGLAALRVVGEFHHVIKIIRPGIAADPKDIHQSVVFTGKRLELQQALELILVGLGPGEGFTEDKFDRAISSKGILGQPEVAAAARINEAEELMFRHHWRGSGANGHFGGRVHAI